MNELNEETVAKQPEGVEEDTPGTEDEEESTSMDALFEDEDDDEEEEEQEDAPAEDTEEPEAPVEGEQEQEQSRVFTQDDVNRIVGNARIKGREYEKVAAELQDITGMELPQIVDYIRNAQVTQFADEKGLPEEEAREILQDKQKLFQMEQQMKEFQEQQQQLGYQQEKSKFIKDPMVKKYEREIDEFSQGGSVLTFEVAMNYVLGEKLRSGEIRDAIKSGTEKQTMANINKRAKAAPETSRVSGATDTTGLTKQERQLAAALGISPKEWATNKGKKK